MVLPYFLNVISGPRFLNLPVFGNQIWVLIELLFLLRRQPMRKAVLMILFKALEVFKVSMICGPTPQRVDHIYTGTVGQ